MTRKPSPKNTLIQVTPDSRGGVKLPREVVREYFSENARQSFAAEGIKFSKERWQRMQAHARKK